MQLAMSAEVLVPLGAGVVALIIALFVALTRAPRLDGSAAMPASESTAAEWTDAGAQGVDPVPGPADPGPTPVHWVTVADVVAMREANPAWSEEVLRRGSAGGAQGGAPRAAQEGPVAPPAVAARTDELDDRARSPARSMAQSATAGSGRAVADVVAQVLAARANAAGRSDVTGRAGRSDPTANVDAAETTRITTCGDVRDRLLAVLLDDPVRAVGATVELDQSCQQLERLSAAIRHERGLLRAVLGRLADAGLATDQIVQLSGLSADDVQELLHAPDGPAP